MRKRARNKLIVNVFGSSTDLSANTPISTYVRRKTPGTSPSSPSFPRESDDSREFSKPFTIPTLPPFFPCSASSESFPLTPKSDIDVLSSQQTSSLYGPKQVSDIDFDILSRRSRLQTGIRISTSPQFADAGEKAMHHRVVHVAWFSPPLASIYLSIHLALHMHLPCTCILLLSTISSRCPLYDITHTPLDNNPLVYIS